MFLWAVGCTSRKRINFILFCVQFVAVDSPEAHFAGGAKKVDISVPSADAALFVIDINEGKYINDIIYVILN